jgi:hypothetical protein
MVKVFALLAANKLSGHASAPAAITEFLIKCRLLSILNSLVVD